MKHMLKSLGEPVDSKDFYVAIKLFVKHQYDCEMYDRSLSQREPIIGLHGYCILDGPDQIAKSCSNASELMLRIDRELHEQGISKEVRDFAKREVDKMNWDRILQEMKRLDIEKEEEARNDR